MSQESDPNSAKSKFRCLETTNARVLVVDDDQLVHKLVNKILRRGDLRYEGASSALEALEMIKKDPPDLILSDIMMPGMNGIEFCETLRREEEFENLPLIFFTGLSDMETLSRAFQVGANDYVIKPLRQVEVLSRVRHHIIEYIRFKYANEQIETLNRQNETKTRFLGVASHDLRNPLVSIRGISQYLNSEKFGPLNDGQKELVQTIAQASESMLTLVEDLLDVAKMDSGKVELETKPEQLHLIAESAVSLHAPNASKKEIQIVAVKAASDSTVNVDRRLISRVTDNLISNAVKFSPSNTTVTVTVEDTDTEVILAIEDEGPGIPETEFKKLFKEFSRTSNQPTAGESSSGIGLFVCRQIVERHGGQIFAANRSQGGACFKAIFRKEKSKCLENLPH